MRGKCVALISYQLLGIVRLSSGGRGAIIGPLANLSFWPLSRSLSLAKGVVL